jgi:transcription elongation factor GreB
MSKAFTNEETPDAPLLAPRRAPLPEGVPNYVTKAGLAALQAELQALERARAQLLASERDEIERAPELAVAQQRIAELEGRIASAELVQTDALSHDRVRFGARVTVRDEDDVEHNYTIVGVDEADAARGRIAFTAPIARALLGKRVGESVSVQTPRHQQELTVTAIEYAA